MGERKAMRCHYFDNVNHYEMMFGIIVVTSPPFIAVSVPNHENKLC